MIEIGRPYLVREGDWCRLCADLRMDGTGTTMYIAVEPEYESYLVTERVDAFVCILLGYALRTGKTLSSEVPMSAQLKYQLEQLLIPTCARFGHGAYHSFRLDIPGDATALPCAGKVATGFSGGVDSLYSIMRHSGEDALYPLTHVTVFNYGAFAPSHFPGAVDAARTFAREQGLSCIAVDTNIPEVLQGERFLDAFCWRTMGVALALQKLWGVYLYSSGYPFTYFRITPSENAHMDLLSGQCLSTETTDIHICGGEGRRVDKLRALCDWEPSYRWLHPCYRTVGSKKNCGKCKKCLRDLVSLYAWDKLDLYADRFDLEDFRQNLTMRLAVSLSRCENNVMNDDAIEELVKSGKPIPPAAYRFAQAFQKAAKGGDSDYEL